MASTLARIRDQRLEKVKKLRAMGIDPYPAASQRTHKNKELLDNFEKYEGKKVIVTGRIMSWREHGMLKFATIQDFSGSIQLILRKDELLKFDSKEQRLGWKELGLIDIGDFVQAEGCLIKSKTGEISVTAAVFKLLVKAIRPLPEKWEGIKDKEIKFRRRYLDMTLSKDVRDRFVRKSKFWRKSREFMLKRGFIEVETPILELVTGGADARPFVTHHHALDQDFYLRISSELYQKRLIGGGFEKIFVLGPNFRNEGIDDEHLQEFYQLEYYWAYSDISDTINLTKELYKYLAQEVYGRTKFTYKNYTFDLADDWDTIDYIEVIKQRFGVDVFKTPLKKIYEIIKKNGIEIKFENNRNRLVDNLWKIIRKEIAGPASLINPPKFISPLAKSYFDNLEVAKRFQPIIAGSEVGNAYSELNDPVDQLERFQSQQKMRDAGDDEAQMLDIDFVEMLEYGMPMASCIGFSERLFWILEGVTAREGTFFPQTKFHLEETTKEIYKIKEPRKVSSGVVNKFTSQISQLKNVITSQSISDIHNPKMITIDKDLLQKYENINVGIAIIRDVDVKKSIAKLEDLKKTVFTGIKKTLSQEDIDDLPNIESYCKMYRQMGVNTGKRKSSPEAMLRRIVEGEDIYRVNTCVDAYNIGVVLNRISAGAFDLAKFEFPVVLRAAEDGEAIEIIGGEVKKLKKGEICYFDKNGPYNMDFNFRDSERTKVTEDTKDLFINVEGVNEITREQVAAQLRFVVEMITMYCGGKVEKIGLVKNSI